MSPDSPINEQESWNKRFEMSLAEIYMELPDGHRAKKDYEALIAEPRGKMVEMSMRIDELEETVRELQLKAPSLIAKPKPVATLCEVVDGLLRDDHFWAWYKEDSVRLYHALTAERKRQEAVRKILEREYQAHVGIYQRCACTSCTAFRALDAFDKGVENG